MTREESRFILFEGSQAIVDFIEANKDDREFGGIEVRQEGKLEIRIRTTTSDSSL